MSTRGDVHDGGHPRQGCYFGVNESHLCCVYVLLAYALRQLPNPELGEPYMCRPSRFVQSMSLGGELGS
jgi:hypothetical protein